MAAANGGEGQKGRPDYLGANRSPREPELPKSFERASEKLDTLLRKPIREESGNGGDRQ